MISGEMLDLPCRESGISIISNSTTNWNADNSQLRAKSLPYHKLTPHCFPGDSYKICVGTAHPSGTHSPAVPLARPTRAFTTTHLQHMMTSKASNAARG